MREIDFISVGGFKVGHAQNLQAGTGLTVILPDKCAPCGVDIRGGGPASRETPLLNPLMASTGIHALVLSGGSAFGLDASGGVMQYLEEHDIGYDVGITKVPLVCQSGLFDLSIGDKTIRPDKKMGYQACQNASYDSVPQGNVGAGTGCSVGKMLGPNFAMKSGIGTYAMQVGDVKVGVIIALHCHPRASRKAERKQIFLSKKPRKQE